MTATAESFARLWRFRELLRQIVLRNLRVKYQGLAIGFAWTLLQPLGMVAILTAVFSYVVRMSVPHYWAFLLSGYFVWNFLSQSISSAAYVLREHAEVARSLAFPLEILVFGALLARLFEFAVELALVVAALAIFHHHGAPPGLAFLPLLVCAQTLLALGLALPIAVLAVFFHDVPHALPIALAMLFYASPVFYPASFVPAAMQVVYSLNPVAELLTLYQECLYAGAAPAASSLLTVGVACTGFAGLGYVVFNRYKLLVPELA